MLTTILLPIFALCAVYAFTCALISAPKKQTSVVNYIINTKHYQLTEDNFIVFAYCIIINIVLFTIYLS